MTKPFRKVTTPPPAFYRPLSAEQQTRHERFRALNDLATKHNGWITSLPGSSEITVECLPESNLPNALADLGHNLIPESDGERILPSAVTERMIRHEDATFGPLTEGSTRAVSVIIGHAGICNTRRFSFVLP